MYNNEMLHSKWNQNLVNDNLQNSASGLYYVQSEIEVTKLVRSVFQQIFDEKKEINEIQELSETEKTEVKKFLNQKENLESADRLSLVILLYRFEIRRILNINSVKETDRLKALGNIIQFLMRMPSVLQADLKYLADFFGFKEDNENFNEKLMEIEQFLLVLGAEEIISALSEMNLENSEEQLILRESMINTIVNMDNVVNGKDFKAPEDFIVQHKIIPEEVRNEVVMMRVPEMDQFIIALFKKLPVNEKITNEMLNNVAKEILEDFPEQILENYNKLLQSGLNKSEEYDTKRKIILFNKIKNDFIREVKKMFCHELVKVPQNEIEAHEYYQYLCTNRIGKFLRGAGGEDNPYRGMHKCVLLRLWIPELIQMLRREFKAQDGRNNSVRETLSAHMIPMRDVQQRKKLFEEEGETKVGSNGHTYSVCQITNRVKSPESNARKLYTRLATEMYDLSGTTIFVKTNSDSQSCFLDLKERIYKGTNVEKDLGWALHNEEKGIFRVLITDASGKKLEIQIIPKYDAKNPKKLASTKEDGFYAQPLFKRAQIFSYLAAAFAPYGGIRKKDYEFMVNDFLDYVQRSPEKVDKLSPETGAHINKEVLNAYLNRFLLNISRNKYLPYKFITSRSNSTNLPNIVPDFVYYNKNSNPEQAKEDICFKMCECFVNMNKDFAALKEITATQWHDFLFKGQIPKLKNKQKENIQTALEKEENRYRKQIELLLENTVNFSFTENQRNLKIDQRIAEEMLIFLTKKDSFMNYGIQKGSDMKEKDIYFANYPALQSIYNQYVQWIGENDKNRVLESLKKDRKSLDYIKQTFF